MDSKHQQGKQQQQQQQKQKGRQDANGKSSAIMIKQGTRATDVAQTPPIPTTPNSLLSKSMQSSLKHEVFDLNVRYGGSGSSSVYASPSPIIHTASGQGFIWNRDVFLRDEYYYASGLHGQEQSQDERVVTHDIILDDDDLMFQ